MSFNIDNRTGFQDRKSDEEQEYGRRHPPSNVPAARRLINPDDFVEDASGRF
jgi:hypothetical protein